MGTLTAGQFAIYGDIKKFLGESPLGFCFRMSADRFRCHWWRRDCEMKKQCYSAEVLIHRRFDSLHARTVVGSAQRSLKESSLGWGTLMLLFLERDSRWRVILPRSIDYRGILIESALFPLI